MIEYTVTELDMRIVDQMMTGDKFNRHTLVEKGEGQKVGLMAEIAFKRLLVERFPDIEYVGHKNYEYDFEIDVLTFDVKAKKRTVSCKPEYECHVNVYQRKSNVMYYVFASVVDDLVQFMGYISKPDFWSKAHIVKKGEDTGIVEGADSAKMFYRDLRPMHDLEENIELYLYRKAFGEVK